MAYAPQWTRNNWFFQPQQRSAPIYLDRSQEYYYEAYLADQGGGYYLQVGLLGGRTKHTKNVHPKAIDEIQRVEITSKKQPNKQVPHAIFMISE